MTSKEITQPEPWWDEFQAAADRQRMSLSAWLGEAGLEKLSKRARNKLPPRPRPGRPRLLDDHEAIMGGGR